MHNKILVMLMAKMFSKQAKNKNLKKLSISDKKYQKSQRAKNQKITKISNIDTQIPKQHAPQMIFTFEKKA